MIELINSLDENSKNFILSNIWRGKVEFDYTNNKNNILVNNEYHGNTIVVSYNEMFIININGNNYQYSIDEFQGLCDNIIDYFNKKYHLSIDIRSIDPVYLSLFLFKRLELIEDIVYDDVYLDDLVLPKHNEYISLTDTEVYRTLLGEDIDIVKKFNSNHVGQTSKERIMAMLESVRQHGYPYNNQFIIVYNDENIIRDGQHRACVLRYLNGNIKVKIMRIYLKKYDKEKTLQK